MQHRRFISLPAVLCLLLLICPLAASADCGDNPLNLLQTANCDMDTDPNVEWSVGPGTASQFAPDGVPAPSALLAPQNLGVVYAVTIDQCVDTTALNDSASVGAWFMQLNGATPECSIQLQVYQGAGCTSTNLGMCNAPLTDVGSTWTQATCDFPFAGTEQSVRVTLSCNEPIPLTRGLTAPNFEVLVDNVFVQDGLGHTPVELESFSVE